MSDSNHVPDERLRWLSHIEAQTVCFAFLRQTFPFALDSLKLYAVYLLHRGNGACEQFREHEDEIRAAWRKHFNS